MPPVVIMFVILENPYEDALGKTNLPTDIYIGVFDPEAENVGFADKYELECVRKYLWKEGFMINPVS